MHTAKLKYINKGLLIIIGVFVFATVASIVFLSYILLRLDSLLTQSAGDVQSSRSVQSLYINLVEAESAARGYALTGNEAYQTGYKEAVSKIPQDLATLSRSEPIDVTKDEQKRLAALSNEKLAVLNGVMAARADRGDAGVQEYIQQGGGRGRQVMDEIQTIVTTVAGRSDTGISQRQGDSQFLLREALVWGAATSLFVLAICVVLVWYFQRTILRERALESTKNEFLSLASHQLRTPATNVKQYVGLLLDGYLGKLTKKQQDALRIAYKNNESEIRIMNDLLDVAKLDLKRIQLRKQPVNIVSVVRQVVKTFEPAAAERNQTLTTKVPAELVAEVDRAYFRGVLEKLIDNAIKYSKNDTRIEIRVKKLENGDMFEVIVKDRGLGIKKREVSKLFSKFTRLTNEFSANSEGSGLGLYWVKQVMNLHGGTVEVKSQEGRGSQFIARSPLK